MVATAKGIYVTINIERGDSKMRTVFTKEWWNAAGIRAIKTMAQTIISMVATAIVLSDVDWKYTLSAMVLAGILSIVTSIAGLPEVDNTKLSQNGKTTRKTRL